MPSSNGHRNLTPSTVTRTLPSYEKAARTHRRTTAAPTPRTPKHTRAKAAPATRKTTPYAGFPLLSH